MNQLTNMELPKSPPQLKRQCTTSLKISGFGYKKHQENEKINVRIQKERIREAVNFLPILVIPNINASDEIWNNFIEVVNPMLLPDAQFQLIVREFGRDTTDEERSSGLMYGLTLYLNQQLPAYDHDSDIRLYKGYLIDMALRLNTPVHPPLIDDPWFVFNGFIKYLNAEILQSDEQITCYLTYDGNFCDESVMHNTIDYVLYYMDKYIVYNMYLHFGIVSAFATLYYYLFF